MIRTILIAVATAALLSVDDVAAQQVVEAGGRTPSMSLAATAPDPRLRPDFAPPSSSAGRIDLRAPRLSLPQAMLVGGVLGCAAGALVMGSEGDDRDRAARRFNGCILGLPIGMVVGGAYGLATGR
ncbi:MAG TPA: hypothetical protein VFR37_14220 [Longimicrobium sp.]|nr:hypothetical protein [Longimicrobium sp.]